MAQIWATSRNKMSKAQEHNLFKAGKGHSPLLSAVTLLQVHQILEDASDTQAKKNFFSQNYEKRGPSKETQVWRCRRE